jgi:hypothetical protein
MISGVTTWITISEQNNRFVATVSVLNDSDRPITVKPDGFTLAVVDPAGRPVSALQLEKLQQKRSLASRIAGAAAGAGRGYENAKHPEVKTGSGTIYNKDGSTSDVDIYGPNTTARDQQAQAQQRQREQAQQRDEYNRQLANTILLANTVNAGGEIDGQVYFPKEVKRYRDLLVTFRVGSLTFEFPWSAADR